MTPDVASLSGKELSKYLGLQHSHLAFEDVQFSISSGVFLFDDDISRLQAASCIQITHSQHRTVWVFGAWGIDLQSMGGTLQGRGG